MTTNDNKEPIFYVTILEEEEQVKEDVIGQKTIVACTFAEFYAKIRRDAKNATDLFTLNVELKKIPQPLIGRYDYKFMGPNVSGEFICSEGHYKLILTTFADPYSLYKQILCRPPSSSSVYQKPSPSSVEGEKEALKIQYIVSNAIEGGDRKLTAVSEDITVKQ